MRLRGMFEGKSSVSLTFCLTLCLWIGTVGAAQEQAAQNSNESGNKPIEEIEVTGRSSLLSLRMDIVNSEIRMFDLFNELNDVRKFHISCEEVMVTGSRIAERECVPIYMKRSRQTNVQNFLFSDLTPPPVSAGGPDTGATSVDVNGMQETEQQLAIRNQPEHREMNAKFAELAARHPELAAAAQDLQTKRQRLAELEELQREESVLGRFFSRVKGKGDQ